MGEGREGEKREENGERCVCVWSPGYNIRLGRRKQVGKVMRIKRFLLA